MVYRYITLFVNRGDIQINPLVKGAGRTTIRLLRIFVLVRSETKRWLFYVSQQGIQQKNAIQHQTAAENKNLKLSSRAVCGGKIILPPHSILWVVCRKIQGQLSCSTVGRLDVAIVAAWTKGHMTKEGEIEEHLLYYDLYKSKRELKQCV